MPRSSTSGRPRGFARAIAHPLAGVLLGLVQTQCTPRTSAEPVKQPGIQAAQLGVLQGTHWLRDPGGGNLQPVEIASDGARRLLLDGVRIEQSPTGALRQSDDFLPAPAQTRTIPAWLGGGYLFFTQVERESWVWRADSWTSPLRGLVRLRATLLDVVAGFDRLYLRSEQGHALRAIDVDDGHALDLGPLPRASSHGALAFATPWLAAVNSDVRGVLVTFDAGNSWHPLGLQDAATTLAVDAGRLEVRSNHDRLLLDERGTVLHPTEDGDENAPDPAQLEQRGGAGSLQPLGDPSLALALTRGFPATTESAIVATRGWLAQVRLRDGAIVRKVALNDRDASQCQALRLGDGYGFVCGDEGDATVIYRYGPGFALSPVLRFSSARRVLANGRGDLLIPGSCQQEASDDGDTQKYCVHDGHDAHPLHIKANDDEHLAALHGGGVVALSPPSAGNPGNLTLHTGAKTKRIELDASDLDDAQRSLLGSGLWLEPLRELADGTLATWVLGARHFAGIRITRQGKLSVGTPRSELPNAVLNGQVGLVLTAGGVGYESTDGGFEWRPFRVPQALGSLDPYASTGSVVRVERAWGCSTMGCALGDWLRVGFGGKARELAPAPQPRTLSALDHGMPHWSLDCLASGEARTGRAALPAAAWTRSGRRAGSTGSDVTFDQLENTSFRPFLGVAAPGLGTAELALDLGSDDDRVQFRGYSWGPRTTRWASAGRWLLRVADRFDTDSVWSTSATRTPWANPALAAAAFGQQASSSVSVDWNVVLDASSRAGLLSIRSHGETELYLASQERPIVAVTNVTNLDHRRPISLAGAAGHEYLGGQSDGMFSVHRLDAGVATPLGHYPQLAADSVRAELVASRSDDALALWIRTADDGWFFYPLDLTTGQAGDPTHVPMAALAGVPPACSDESQGWLVISEVPLSTLGGSAANVWLAFEPALSGLRARRLEARVIASSQGLCLQAVAAQLDDSSVVPRHVRMQAGASEKPVTLTLTDRATERRLGFRCSR